tara:strand:+ start:119 stop:358 length:240 start_codon:yes stop_codon:yes gene_type:complete
MYCNNLVFLLLLVLVGIYVFQNYCNQSKSNLYQGSSMSGVFSGPMADGPSGGMIEGGQGSGGDLSQLDGILTGRNHQQF